MTAQPLSDIQIDEIADFLNDMLRYKQHVMSMLPDEFARHQERLHKLRFGDGQRRTTDNDVFYRIGVAILSRHKEPITMGQLSKELMVPLSTATRIVDGLVSSGLAERVNDQEDRRIVRVALTHEGQELYGFINEFVRQRVQQILALLRKAMNHLHAREE
jgi:DNA-binding MarR family transcriptional regulator